MNHSFGELIILNSTTFSQPSVEDCPYSAQTQRRGWKDCSKETGFRHFLLPSGRSPGKHRMAATWVASKRFINSSGTGHSVHPSDTRCHSRGWRSHLVHSTNPCPGGYAWEISDNPLPKTSVLPDKNLLLTNCRKKQQKIQFNSADSFPISTDFFANIAIDLLMCNCLWKWAIIAKKFVLPEKHEEKNSVFIFFWKACSTIYNRSFQTAAKCHWIQNNPQS